MNRRATIAAMVASFVVAAASVFVAWTTAAWQPVLLAIVALGVGLFLSTQLRPDPEAPR